MEKRNIKSIEGLYRLIDEYHSDYVTYRGVSWDKYDLEPNVSRQYRDNNIKSSLREYEEALIKQFYIRASSLIKDLPRNKWEILSLAQHHRLPTRLLDWSFNPLVALFFVIQNTKRFNVNGLLYIDLSMKFIDTRSSRISDNPIYYDGVGKFIPVRNNNRIQIQESVFTISSSPNIPLEQSEEYSNNIVRVFIPKGIKIDLLESLRRYGIHEATLIPTLDNISTYIHEDFVSDSYLSGQSEVSS